MNIHAVVLLRNVIIAAATFGVLFWTTDGVEEMTFATYFGQTPTGWVELDNSAKLTVQLHITAAERASSIGYGTISTALSSSDGGDPKAFTRWCTAQGNTVALPLNRVGDGITYAQLAQSTATPTPVVFYRAWACVLACLSVMAWCVWSSAVAIVKMSRADRALCANCGYPRGVRGNVCSECGRPFESGAGS